MTEAAERRKDRLTPEQARQALYIDFEGGKGEPPVLLGCGRRTGRGQRQFVPQYITDVRFAPLADDEVEVLPLTDAVERILQRAKSKDRLIVAWSNHELDVVKEYCPKQVDRFQARYVNARTFAVYWRNACHAGERPATNTLADYLALVDYKVSDGAGPGNVGETVSRIARSLAKGKGEAGLTDDQRRRWCDLREHNLHDCRGMKEVSVRAAEEIAARDRQRGLRAR